MAQHLESIRKKNNIFKWAKQRIASFFWHSYHDKKGRDFEDLHGIRRVKPEELLSKNPNRDLFEAADHGQFAIAKAALKKGADPNIRDRKTRDTPLILAVQEGHADICKLLLEHGADPFKKNIFGLDASTIAASARNPEVSSVFAGYWLEGIFGRDAKRFHNLILECTGSK